MAGIFEKGAEDARALLKVLEPYAEDPEEPYWMAGNHALSMPICYPCAEEALAHGLGEFIDGGWEGEEDGCCACYYCGDLLQYTLTDYGTGEELGHYQENPPTAPLSTRNAYEIARLLCAAPDNEDALTIGRLAVAAIPLTMPKYQMD